jgi:aryl-alcohol dehydrogenase-like predicted oxidoreductase
VLPDRLARRSRREEELRTLDALVEAGCSAFDLAASYQLGGTERLFGEWMASRRLRTGSSSSARADIPTRGCVRTG